MAPVHGSCLAEIRHQVQRLEKLAPDAAANAQDPAAGGGEPVVALAPLAGLLDPASRDPALLLELVEQRIKRRRLEMEPALRARLDDLGELVPVAIRAIEDRQHQKLGA